MSQHTLCLNKYATILKNNPRRSEKEIYMEAMIQKIQSTNANNSNHFNLAKQEAVIEKSPIK